MHLKGDLGVQRGVLRWFLSWHDPLTSSTPVKLRKDKVPKKHKPTEIVESSLIKKLQGIAKSGVSMNVRETK